MRQSVLGLAIAASITLTGCQTTGLLNGANPGGLKGTSSTASPAKLGGLQFKSLSQEAAQGFADRATGSGRAESTAAPAAAPAMGGASIAVGEPNGKMANPYSFRSYFGGPLGQMKLEGASEASAPGTKGGWADIKAQVVDPALADWAADARLLSSNGTLDAQGNVLSGEESYPGEFGWHATYGSASRSEVLEFNVSAKETKVVKLRWVPISLDPGDLKIDAKSAISKLTAAIKDAAFKSKEEQLGRDYFFGTDNTGGGRVGIAVPMPAIAVDAPASAPGAPGASEGGAPAPDIGVAPTPMPAPFTTKEEQLTTLVAGGRWNASLEAIGDSIVWSLNYNPARNNVGTPTMMPAIARADAQAKPVNSLPEPYVDQYAFGMIDARTGEVIRLRRPMRVTYEQGSAVSAKQPAGSSATASPDGKVY